MQWACQIAVSNTTIGEFCALMGALIIHGIIVPVGFADKNILTFDCDCYGLIVGDIGCGN